jgi:hypothetical protein
VVVRVNEPETETETETEIEKIPVDNASTTLLGYWGDGGRGWRSVAFVVAALLLSLRFASSILGLYF